ncbi:MAG: hypothetical protein R3228_18035 [Halioglobus sp.]|nr:hypothetical protein [Halioglobus sp.]
MLRIIAIALVLANLLLLGIRVRQPEEPGQAEVAIPEAIDDGVPTIHLIEELVQQQAITPDQRQCFSLGPFHSTEERDSVRMQLRGRVTGVSERQTQAMVERGYWVFLPPYESLLEANRALLSLRALGLEDIAIVYEETEWQNAISLGYFLRQGNANQRAKQLRDRGYGVQVQVTRRAEPRYWLDYEQDPGVELLKLDMQDVPLDFRQRILPCPDLGFFSSTAPPEPTVDAAGTAAGREPAADAGISVSANDSGG